MNNYPEIEELNKNSKLKYFIGDRTCDILEKTNKEYKKIHNFMSLDYFIPDSGKVAKYFVSFYGFPTDESPACLAEYRIYNKEDNILGIKVGDNFEEAQKKIFSFGYTKVEYFYQKGVVQIKLSCDENNNIKFLSASLKSKYLGNVLY